MAQHQFNDGYRGANLNRIAFPIGGIGTGMYCLEGTGAISHMSVRNQMDFFNEPSYAMGNDGTVVFENGKVNLDVKSGTIAIEKIVIAK